MALLTEGVEKYFAKAVNKSARQRRITKMRADEGRPTAAAAAADRVSSVIPIGPVVEIAAGLA
jgi:hypothetical protein